ncbi:MAG: HEAT repeat domain-containing protein [Gammaproteobacteria bacterium]|nr:HEAT repeat domain-containing protein [Gammaproteobacteria bacterium]
MAKREQWNRWLLSGLDRQWQKIYRELLDELWQGWQIWLRQRQRRGDQRIAAEEVIGQSIITWLLIYIDQRQEKLIEIETMRSRFIADYDHAIENHERERIILDYAALLGASGRSLRGDRRALKRWFDRDAMVDRFIHRFAEQEQRLAFALERLGEVALLRIGGQALTSETGRRLWGELQLEVPLRDLLSYEGDHRVSLAAFRALGRVLRAMPDACGESLVGEETLRYIYRSALESRQSVWIQAEALEILAVISPPSLEVALGRRLGEVQGGDDLFLRRRAVTLLVVHAPHLPQLQPLLPQILADPNPFVRQGFATALGASDCLQGVQWLSRLLGEEKEPSVRCAAALALQQRAERFGSEGAWPQMEEIVTLLGDTLRQEQEPLLFRTLLQLLVELGEWLQQQEAEEGQRLPQLRTQALAEVVAAALSSAEAIPMKRWAAQAGERIWLLSQPDLLRLRQRLKPRLAAISPGRSGHLSRAEVQAVGEERLGRLLAVMALDDFPLELQHGIWGYRLHRGHRFAFRWWRFWQELRTPATDKRQAFSHLIGRRFVGAVRAPSAILSEMSPTKVPGEPLQIEEEGGWRPYLPLGDDLLSVLELGKRVQLYSSQGVTTITPPRWIWQRLLAWGRLSHSFHHYSDLRNFRKVEGGKPGEYLSAMQRLGFSIQFQPHYRDATVERYFPGALTLPLFEPELLFRFEEYFFSAYENSIYELMIFTAVALLGFLLRHLFLGRKILNDRREIPLVVGGWGTRGKSGTERLKAAVFHSKGLGVISKTTGCEAMFIHAPPFMTAREMFLFRPYDKATIWEQHNLISISRRLDCQVFLWECMALTPEYVRLLQRDWMRDDVATITNAYPDHEDLQGPAGINIPEVIAQFIPERSRVISSEDQMSPILRHEALRVNSDFTQVGWLEAGLLTPDILERFPYAEHPNNIALVTAMGRALGLAEDETLKAMADEVIPDIGVLKIYPEAWLEQRGLSFVNGMSANERLGCLGNWQRSGFAAHHPESEPQIWISTVVNNRADRVARTRVFARLLVRDISADCHLLIGGNLDGFMGFIEQELDERLAALTLSSQEGEETTPLQRMESEARWQRIPLSDHDLRQRIAAMVAGVGVAEENHSELLALAHDQEAFSAALQANGVESAEEIASQSQLLHQNRRLCQEWQERAESASPLTAEDDAKFRQQCRHWFLQRVVILWDYHASGNDIIRKIVRLTPPGLHNRIMGVQNIKGTGLDFVYRWQAWDHCYQGCREMTADASIPRLEGMKRLSQFSDFGPLAQELVQRSVEAARGYPEMQSEKNQATLTMILSNLETAVARDSANAGGEVKSRSRFAVVFDALEAFLDAGDAVKRRKEANLIYRELMAERVSRQKASEMLGALIKRQKGGWLSKMLESKPRN